MSVKSNKVKSKVKKVNKKKVNVKKVVKRVAKKKVVKLDMGSRIKGGKGIGIFIKNMIIDMKVKGNLDYKVIDSECYKKFGLSKNGKKTRMKSIVWQMNDLKNFQEWNGVVLNWED